MLKKGAMLLRGVIHVHITSPFPERVLNVCTARGVSFWDLQWCSATELRFAIRRADYRALREALYRIDAQISVDERSGVPYFLRRFRRRYSLLIGLGALVLLLIVNSLFVWDFEVSGSETVPEEKILRALENAGLHYGTFAYSFRPQELCNRALLELPELAWLTVNIRGCRAYVEVRERVAKPEIADDTTPTNVIAKKTALVTQVQAYSGEKKVLPGTMVLKGQLLISGTVDTQGPVNPSVATRLLAGRGKVYGRTWYDLSIKIPLRYELKTYEEKENHEISIHWGTKRVKFGGKESSNIGTNCDKIIKMIKPTLPGGFALPFSIEIATRRPYTTQTVERSRSEAEEMGKEQLLAYLHQQIDGEISTTRFSSAVQGDWLLVTLSAECLEQIGQSVAIPVE